MVFREPGSRPSPGTESANSLILDFPNSQAVRNEFLLFTKHSASGICYGSQNGLTQMDWGGSTPRVRQWSRGDASGLNPGRSKAVERNGLVPRVFGEQTSDGEDVGKEGREESKDSWGNHVAVP